MKRVLIAPLAILLTVGTQSSQAFHRHKHFCCNYGQMPVMPMQMMPSMGFSSFSYGAPFTSFSYSAPAFSFAAPAFSFSAPAPAFGLSIGTGFGFSAPSGLGLSLVPNTGLSLSLNGGVGTGFASSAEAQGFLDQVLLPLILRQFMGGSGGGGRLTLTEQNIKDIATQIVSQSELKNVATNVADVEKILRALLKKHFPDVKVPDVIPPITYNILPSPSAPQRAHLQTMVAEVTAIQASWDHAGGPVPVLQAAGQPQSTDLQSLFAEIKAKQAEWNATASPPIATARK